MLLQTQLAKALFRAVDDAPHFRCAEKKFSATPGLPNHAWGAKAPRVPV
jgi:hypothetical protein